MSRKKQETVVDVAATQTPPPSPIQVSRENLVSGLADVKPVIGKGGLYALSHVLMEVTGNQLQLAATNMDIVIRTFVHIQGNGAGWKMTVPAHTLDEVVRSLPNDTELTLQMEEGNQLRITADRMEARIKGLPAAEFPLLPSFKADEEASLAAGAWGRALKQALTAVAKDDAMPSLTHVHVEGHDGRLVMTATDSHRLARAVCGGGGPCAHDVVWMFPKMLAKLVADASAKREGGGPVLFAWEDAKKVMFDFGATVIQGTSSDMTFPDFRKIVEETFLTTDINLVFDKAQLGQALRVVGVMMPDSRQVRLRLGRKEMTMWSGDDHTGETQQLLPYHRGEVDAGTDGEELELAVNGRYLRDAVDACTGELVLLRVAFADRSCPFIVASVEEGAEDYHLIMPMHMQK